MPFVVYDTVTGRLVSKGTGSPPSVDPPLATREYPGGFPSDFLWNDGDQDFTTPKPPPPQVINGITFWLLFTRAERTAIRQSSDNVVLDALFILDHAPGAFDARQVNVSGFLSVLEGLGILTPARVAEIEAELG